MVVCVTCKKEMECYKNGVGLDFGYGHVYHSDVFRCPECWAMFAVGAAFASQDPEYLGKDSYIQMQEHTMNPPDTYAPAEKQFDACPENTARVDKAMEYFNGLINQMAGRTE